VGSSYAKAFGVEAEAKQVSAPARSALESTKQVGRLSWLG
jgi:hypothetical protein